jgi:hypothetical protein
MSGNDEKEIETRKGRGEWSYWAGTPTDLAEIATLARELVELDGRGSVLKASDPPAEAVRSGKALESIASGEQALATAHAAEAELARRDHRTIIERLPLARQLRDAKRQAHPATRWLDAARRYSAPELVGERLVADRLTEEDARELETLVKRKGEILTVEGVEPLTDDETAAWERLMGLAAGDPDLFARKRRDAAAKAKLDRLKDEHKVAALPRQPLLAEPGAVQLPRFAVHSWLVGHEAHEGAWSLMDLGLLAALLGTFANRDPSLIVGARFDEEGDDLTLVVPGGIGSSIHFHGRIAGSPLEGGSGFVRGRPALTVLKRNRWLEVEETVRGAADQARGNGHGS